MTIDFGDSLQATPWEIHEGIWVKREDLSCPSPGPMFSKVRGVLPRLIRECSPLFGNMFPSRTVGVVDSRHSKAGWGVAYLAQKLPKPPRVVVFYPQFKGEADGYLRPFQQKCVDFGAEMVPLRGGLMSAVNFNIAKKQLAEMDTQSYMFPNGLKLPESVDGTALELENTLPSDLVLSSDSTWVISASSGTLAAGVCLGLQRSGYLGKVVLHLGYSRPEKPFRKYLTKFGVTDIQKQIEVVDEGYKYADLVSTPVPFPCNPYYDRKAWKWIQENREGSLKGRQVCMWNIGA